MRCIACNDVLLTTNTKPDGREEDLCSNCLLCVRDIINGFYDEEPNAELGEFEEYE